MKKIILIITGSIAAPKALDLYHLLKKKYHVTIIATPNAKKFVSFPEDLNVYQDFLERDFYQKNDRIDHTDFALNNDLIIVYPATMTFISKAALAICDNLALATFLASSAKKIIFPAMNHNMYHNQGLQNNLSLLMQDPKLRVVDTDRGLLACNVIGDGRVKEPKDAFKIIEQYQIESTEMTNKTVLINYGSSRTYLDDIRYLTTHSSGKMGQALVSAFLKKNAKVIAIIADVSIPLIHDSNLTIIRANSNQTIFKAMDKYFLQADVVICVAALNDYQLQEQYKGKISKTEHEKLQLNLIANIDVLANLGKQKEKQLLIGFSAQDSSDSTIAKKKIENKNCDGIIMNNIDTMNQDQTEVDFYFKDKSYLINGSKIEVAKEIVSIISSFIS